MLEISEEEKELYYAPEFRNRLKFVVQRVFGRASEFTDAAGVKQANFSMLFKRGNDPNLKSQNLYIETILERFETDERFNGYYFNASWLTTGNGDWVSRKPIPMPRLDIDIDGQSIVIDGTTPKSDMYLIIKTLSEKLQELELGIKVK